MIPTGRRTTRQREAAASAAARGRRPEPDVSLRPPTPPAVPSPPSQTSALRRRRRPRRPSTGAPPANGALAPGRTHRRRRRPGRWAAGCPASTPAGPVPGPATRSDDRWPRHPNWSRSRRPSSPRGTPRLPTLLEHRPGSPGLLAVVRARTGRCPGTLPAVQLLAGEVAVQLVEPRSTLAAPWRPDPVRTVGGGCWPTPTSAATGGRSPTRSWSRWVWTTTAPRGWSTSNNSAPISLTGDPTYAADFARYLAAEIAVNPWSRQVHLDCIGIAPEAVAARPGPHPPPPLDDPTALDAAIVAAGTTIEKCTDHDVTAAAGRADDLGGDLWDSWLVLVNGALSTPRSTSCLTSSWAIPRGPAPRWSWSATASPSVASASG